MLLPDGERKTNKQISSSKRNPPLKAWKELPTIIYLSILMAGQITLVTLSDQKRTRQHESLKCYVVMKELNESCFFFFVIKTQQIETSQTKTENTAVIFSLTSSL